MVNDSVLYEDETILIRWKEGFLENPAHFKEGTGIEHIIKNATEVKI